MTTFCLSVRFLTDNYLSNISGVAIAEMCRGLGHVRAQCTPVFLIVAGSDYSFLSIGVIYREGKRQRVWWATKSRAFRDKTSLVAIRSFKSMSEGCK